MTTPLAAAALLASATKERILKAALELAALVGLPVESWRPGDPTRTLFVSQAEITEQRDLVQVEYAKASFLDTAEGDMLALRASDVYNVPKQLAVAATATVTVDNTGGGFYEVDAGGLVFSNSSTGQTYINQAVVTINPLEEGIEISVVAQAAGAEGTSAEDGIDTIVGGPLGVEVTASTAAVGADAQSDPGLREQCRASIGALSPNGPADAYGFVARSEELTGIAGVTRAASDGDNTTGDVTVYVATSTAALDGPSVAAIQAAVDEWATPLCTDATVVSGTPQTINFQINLTPDIAGAQAAIEQVLTDYLATVNLGGTVSRSQVDRVVHNLLADDLTTMVVIAPASDVVLAAGVFPIRGTVVLS